MIDVPNYLLFVVISLPQKIRLRIFFYKYYVYSKHVKCYCSCGVINTLSIIIYQYQCVRC